MLKRLAGLLLIGIAFLTLVSCVQSGDIDPSSDSVRGGEIADGPRVSTAESPELGSNTAQQHPNEAHSNLRAATPDPLRGIYLTGWTAGTRLDETIEYMHRHQLNALVVDVKDTDGRLSFDLPGTLADELGASAGKMGSLEKVRGILDTLREQGIYVIGRVALFQDNFLPHKRPEWALQTSTGEPWRDVAGNYWLDPTHPAVLDYHVEIAVAAAELGFDEIQFDYLRYPSQRVAGYNDGPREDRVEAITGFITAARDRIQEQVNIPISGAIYGIVAVSDSDYHLGQELVNLTKAMEYVSPMFYPSHYRAGDFGLSSPGDEPYKTVFASTAAALGRIAAEQWKQLRPWIQSFFGYEAPQVEAQIRALKDLGVESFLVWNPSGRYIDGVDYVQADGRSEWLAKSPFRSVLYTMLSPAVGVFVPDTAIKLPPHLGFLTDHHGHDLRVEATRLAGGYRIEVRRPASSKAPDSCEERLLLMTLRPSGERSDPPIVEDSVDVPGSDSIHEGAELRWTDEGYEWYLWAPSLSAALKVKNSLQALPAELF